MAYPDVVLADGPLGYWKLNEAPGSSTFADATGNGWNGTADSGGLPAFGQAGLVPSLPGDTCAGFGGGSGVTTGFCRVPGVGGAVNDLNGQSLEMWLFVAGSQSYYAYKHIAAATNDYDVDDLFMSTMPIAFCETIAHGRNLPRVAPNATHHLVLTRLSGGNLIAYIDGAQVGTVSANPFGVSTDFTIGGNPAIPTGFGGRIAHVSLYNKVLTATQVLNHVLAGIAAASGTSLRVNIGGGAATPFAAEPGWYAAGTQASTGSTIDVSRVTSPAPQTVYQTQRWASRLTYRVPFVSPASGLYTVRLHFAEQYWTSAGNRVFSVTINGTTVVPNLDLAAVAGQNVAYIVQAANVAPDSNGVITIDLQASRDNAILNGFEVISAGTVWAGSAEGLSTSAGSASLPAGTTWPASARGLSSASAARALAVATHSVSASGSSTSSGEALEVHVPGCH